ncbi:MAG TPA: response regulator transcription factor [Bryobacteraceae bacterium]|nr:response regulator transcription factor [Bryobacteraceae bacterium]
MSTPAAIKVTIVEDVPNIREGLKALIDGTDGYVCTGALVSMEEAIPQIAGSRPDVVLVDIGLPGMSGIVGIRKLKEKYPDIAVLILTVYDDDKRIFEALCEGACGYLLKKTPPAKLLESIQEAMNGGAPMSPEIARRVVALFREFQPPRESDYQLTPHEMRLLKLLVDGHNYKSAAAELNVSVNTIRFHMRSVYDKLQVHSKSEAVSKALRNRIIR